MKKKLLSVVLAGTVIFTSLSTGISTMAAENQNGTLTVEKISHPDRGEGQIDGILPFEMMGEEANRNQSYVWSVAEYGDYIYMGSCWNPISGIYYRNLRDNLTKLFQSQGMDRKAAQEKASQLAKDVMNVLYHGNFPDGSTAQKGTPFIARMNKYTNEMELVYVEKENSQFINWNGYRMAQVYNDKIYFVCAGYPTSRLLQIDPETLDTKIVMQKTAENPGFSNGIRGLTVMNGELIVSLATDGADPDHMFENGSPLPKPYQDAIKQVAKKDTKLNDPNPTLKGARILSTSNPEDPNGWKIIADQETFHNLPACYVADSINGGGVWDLVPFEGSLYATMVTGKTDPKTKENHKQGFAMYKGTPDANGNWKWLPIIGDTSKGAQYEFGLGKKESCAGNLFVFKDQLYIGGYNDPMLDLAQIGNEGNFEPLYNDLKNPACLYRMDKSGNIETINDDGFGAASTQYLWRFSEYNGKLFIGTFDISTLASGFTQLTDGSLLELTPEEFMQELEYIKTLLEDLGLTGQPEEKPALLIENEEEVKETETTKTEEVKETETENTEEVKEAEEASKTEEVKETETENTEEVKETETENTEEVKETETENTEEVKETETENTEEVKETEEASKTEDVKEVEVPEQVENIFTESEQDRILEMIEALDNMEAKANAIENDVETYGLGEDIVKMYDELKDIFEKLKPILDAVSPEVTEKIESILLEPAFHHFIYYLGCSDIIKDQEKGCDILYSEDGENFKVLTRNGFNDEFNHGGRAFIPTDNGLYVGMANPFWGAQLWKITDGTEKPSPEVKPENPEINPEKPEVKPDKPEVKPETKPEQSGNGGIKTGDSSNIMLWSTIVLFSAGIATTVVFKRRKHS